MIKLILGFVGIPMGGFILAVYVNYYYTGKFLIDIPPIIEPIKKKIKQIKDFLKKEKEEDFFVI